MDNLRKSYLTARLLSLLALFILPSCAMMDMAEDNMDIHADRTVLVYMAADNNLASFARRNIEAMKQGDIPYYFDSGSGNVLLVYADISGEKPRLMRLSKDRFGAVNTEILMEYEDQNSCSDSVMREVLTYAASLFPSDDNGLVLWSHGTGWLPEGYYSNPYSTSADGSVVPQNLPADPYAGYVKSFGADDGREMDITALESALPIHYSYILMDACLMGGIEVAYELKNKCDYFVGSAAEVLANGFPYDLITGYLFRGLTGLKLVCEEYYNYYGTAGATVSIVDTRKLNALAESCLDIFLTNRRAIAGLDMDSLQGYFRNDRHWFYDLDDFVGRIATKDQYDVFSTALEDAVVYRRATDEFVLDGFVQYPIEKFSGLSTYVPNPENDVLDRYYKGLAWNLAVRMVE